MALLRRINHTPSTEIPLDRKELTFGRDQTSDVCIDKYGGISRNHCGFQRYEDGVVTVTDFGSRNGTFVNGKQIFEETRLTHGDEVRVCQEVEFVFVDFDSPEGKAAVAQEERERKEEEERRKREIKVEGDSEASKAMNELSDKMNDGVGFKTIMAEIVSSTKKKPTTKRAPKALEKEDHESVNEYEEFNVKRRRL